MNRGDVAISAPPRLLRHPFGGRVPRKDIGGTCHRKGGDKPRHYIAIRWFSWPRGLAGGVHPERRADSSLRSE